MLPPVNNQPVLSSDEEKALARKNIITAAWVVAVIVVMLAFSYFGRLQMVSVLFKTL